MTPRNLAGNIKTVHAHVHNVPGGTLLLWHCRSISQWRPRIQNTSDFYRINGCVYMHIYINYLYRALFFLQKGLSAITNYHLGKTRKKCMQYTKTKHELTWTNMRKKMFGGSLFLRIFYFMYIFILRLTFTWCYNARRSSWLAEYM